MVSRIGFFTLFTIFNFLPFPALCNTQVLVPAYQDSKPTSDATKTAAVLLEHGLVQFEGRRMQDAFENISEAYRRSKVEGDQVTEGWSLVFLGGSYQMAGLIGNARPYYLQALTIFQDIGDRRAEAFVLNLMGMVTVNSHASEARKQYEAALSIQKDINDQEAVANTLSSLAAVDIETGNYRTALETYKESLGLYRRIGNESGEATALLSMGITHIALEDFEIALGLINESRNITRRVESVRSSHTLEPHAVPKTNRSFHSYHHALQTYRSMVSWLNAISQLHALGGIKLAVGQPGSAYDYFIQAVSKAREIGDRRYILISMLALSNAMNKMGKAWEELEPILVESLSLAKEINDERLTSLLINNIAFFTGPSERSLEMYEKAILLARRRGDLYIEAIARLNMAGTRLFLGYPSEAETDAQVACGLFEKIGRKGNRAVCLYYLAHAQSKLRKVDHSIRSLEVAVSLIEEIKGKISSDTVKQGYQADKLDIFNFLIELLVNKNAYKKAFEYLEKSKSAHLLEMFFETGFGTSDPALQNRLEALRNMWKQNALVERRISEEKGKPIAEQDSTLIETLVETAASTKGDFNKIVVDLQITHPEYYRLLEVKPTQLSNVGKGLPSETVLLQYFFTKDMVYIFVISPNKHIVKKVQIPATNLTHMVRRFRDGTAEYWKEYKKAAQEGDTAKMAISNWNLDITDGGFDLKKFKENSHQLFKILIEPVGDDIKNFDHLVIVPFGSLYYLPFAGIGHVNKDGEWSFLVDEKEVSYLSSSTLLQAVKEKTGLLSKHKSLVAFSDPDGTLPWALVEVEAIAKLFQMVQVWNGTEASERNLLSIQDASYVHFATHAGASDTPFLILGSSDGTQRIGLRQIAALPFGEENVLVTLSACSTALGNNPTGEEIMSLSWAFSVAGAPSILSTQWDVEDFSTGILMEDFYKHHLRGLGLVTSIRMSQQALKSDPRYSHPYFWAPFVLTGKWN